MQTMTHPACSEGPPGSAPRTGTAQCSAIFTRKLGQNFRESSPKISPKLQGKSRQPSKSRGEVSEIQQKSRENSEPKGEKMM